MELTEAGEALREQALTVPEVMMRRLGLSEEQFLDLHRTLTELLAGLTDAQQLR